MFAASSVNAAAVLNNQVEETLGGRSEYSFSNVLEIETLGQFLKEDIVWTIISPQITASQLLPLL